MENAHKPAGLARRFASLMIDMALSVPLFYVCLQFASYVPSEISFTLILVVLYTLFLSSNWRATPGMRITKIEAYGTDGQPLSKAHAIFWCVASSLFAVMAFAPLLYVQWWMGQYDLAPLMAAVNSGQIDEATFSMELQAKTGISAQEMSGMFMMCLATTFVLCLIWALSVVLSKRKIGWHNWLSATRFVVRAS